MKRSCFKGCFCSKVGFTLIELLVVVLIIGILAAVAVPQYQHAIKKVQFTKMRVLADSLTKASQTAYLRTGVPPTTFDELDLTMTSEYSIFPVSANMVDKIPSCMKGPDFYCCLTVPVSQHTGQGVSCVSNNYLFAYAHNYISSTGISTEGKGCAQKIGKISLCQKLPGAKEKSGTSIITPSQWQGGYAWYNID